MNTRNYSALWLPVFLILGGLIMAGCGSTAPNLSSVNTPDSLEVGESGTFEANLTNQDDADKPLTYAWDYGDGSTGSGLITTHSYSRAGTYTVSFKASNEGGADSSSASVTVFDPPEPAQITSLNADPNPVDEGEQVSFSSNVTGDTPVDYEWSFGDGSSGSGSQATHTYDSAGQYTVELVASNSVGEDSRSITLRVEKSLPEICTTVSEFNSAFFGRNSSTLTDEAKSSLEENADILGQCPNLTVRVEGFAAPGERNSESLSDDRAQAVADFYSDNDIESNRINTSGEGEVSGVTSKKGGTREYRRADSIPQR